MDLQTERTVKPDLPTSNYFIRQFVGAVFEEFAAELLGGIRVPRRSQYIPGDLAPDLELPDSDSWVEVKATQKGRAFKIHRAQLEKYVQITDIGFPYSKVLYLLISHDTQHISKRFTCSQKLEKALLNSVVSLAMLDGPFRSIVAPLRTARREVP